MKQVSIVGAGFSGLTLAFELHRLGFKVKIHERHKRPGGLLGTSQSAFGLAETAANALLANHEIEELFEELKVPFAERLPQRKRRYIYWEGPRRWPLSKTSTAKLIWTAAKIALGKTEAFPHAGETVHEWAKRALDPEIEERLLQPALQGIYAGSTKQLSAALTLQSLMQSKAKKGRWKGSVAPQGGMNQLIEHLEGFLKETGTEFHYQTDFTLPEFITEPTVICTNAWSAAEIMKSKDPQLADKLSSCESLPLVSVTSFFESNPNDLEGFGCLFPPSQGFSASGVLFNSSIFNGRSKMRSETWIFGGSHLPECVTWSDERLVETIVKDRQKLTGRFELPRNSEISRWPRAIPHYSVKWETTLKNIKAKPPIFLHGNYLGAIGLARIYSRSRELAQQMKEMYG